MGGSSLLPVPPRAVFCINPDVSPGAPSLPGPLRWDVRVPPRRPPPSSSIRGTQGGDCPSVFSIFVRTLLRRTVTLPLSPQECVTHCLARPRTMGKDGEGGGAGAATAAQAESGGGKEGLGKGKGKGKVKVKEGADRRGDPQKCCGCRFPLLIAALQLLLAIAITVVAFIMRSISSSLLLRDTPYWAGIIICLTALLGFYMHCIIYEVDEHTARQFIVKLIYFLLCTLGLILCISAVAFAGHHYNQITKFTCQMNLEHCICKQDPEDQIARTFQYSDVHDCDSVTNTIKLYLLLQMVLNLTLALVCLLGCYMMWKDRYQVFFAGLHFHPLKSTSQQQERV